MPKLDEFPPKIKPFFVDTCDFWKILYLSRGMMNGKSSTDLFVNEIGFRDFFSSFSKNLFVLENILPKNLKLVQFLR